ncbi:MAG: transcription termination/antitermination protein NusA, partial [Chloroflexi bacterium]|nr:transcription termination/antitermination protein NusA [Chloroflexota bacterium]
MKSEFEIAITQLSADRNLAPEVIIEAIETALVSAYKRNFGSNQNVEVVIHPRTGQAQVFVRKTVVERVEDEQTEISLADARLYDPNAKLGDTVSIEVKPRNF